MAKGEVSSGEGIGAVIGGRGVAQQIAIIDHIANTTGAEVCDAEWLGGDGGGGAIGVEEELGANDKLAVLGSRENNRVPSAAGGDGGGEGSGDGDAVVAGATIHSDGGVAACCGGAGIGDGDGVIAEPAAGGGGTTTVGEFTIKIDGKGIIAIAAINKGGLDDAPIAIGRGRKIWIDIRPNSVIAGIAVKPGVCNAVGIYVIVVSTTPQFCG